MSTCNERVALCALNRIYGYHPALALEMIQKHGSAMSLFHNPPGNDERHPELSSRLVPGELEEAARELEKVESGGFRFITMGEDDYPEALRELPDPPLGLYINGTSAPAEIFSLRPMVAFVGTRDLSPYGKAWCARLVKELSRARVQPCIVSGMALGADGVAHRTALECGLPTIGVMATGIDDVYPRQHSALAMDIVRSPGSALITDYPLGTAPVALNFLRRNRIIAGLSMAVVVVESKTKGGSLMTARFAVEYSRDVYALPGRADDIRSAGCNSLIREHMAEIITTPEMLVDALGLGGPVRHRGEGGSWITATPGETVQDALRRILSHKYGHSANEVSVGLAILGSRGIYPETLSGALSLPMQAVLSAIGTLEADGVVESDLLRRCSISARYGG